jgi:hypothetical protein
MAKTFLILGGYGNTGRLIARLLLHDMQRMGIAVQIEQQHPLKQEISP